MFINKYEKAVLAAVRAGEAIMEIYSQPTETWDVEFKSDNSPVTLADRRAHAIIAEMLADTEIPLLSEEGEHNDFASRQGWKRLWMVDPLDGTKEFISRNGVFTVNIALIEDCKPVWGVIYFPVDDVLYVGGTEQAPLRIEHPLDKALRRATLLPQKIERPFTVVASRSHFTPETKKFIDNLRKEHPDLECITSGSSLKLCRVAEGMADIYPRFAPAMEWDIAAGDAIVRAAGGKVVNAETGEPLAYNKADLHSPWVIASL